MYERNTNHAVIYFT